MAEELSLIQPADAPTFVRYAALPAHLARMLNETEQAWRGVTIAPLSIEHSRLFLGAGLVPLREGGFGDGMRFAGQPVDIADVSGFYLAFGFALPDYRLVLPTISARNSNS